MDIKGISGETSDGNEENVIRHWREVANNLAELCSRVMWKVGFVKGYLAEEILSKAFENVLR